MTQTTRRPLDPIRRHPPLSVSVAGDADVGTYGVPRLHGAVTADERVKADGGTP